MKRRFQKKSANSVSIIGGADGPTSIFIAGKDDKISWIEKIKRKRYQKKRARIENMLEANPHTIEETIEYMKEKYQAEELSKESFVYTEQLRCLKESLILQHKPELLGEWGEIPNPTDWEEDSLKEFFAKLEQRSKKAQEIPDYLLPMDFHIYKIEVPKMGEIQFEVEKNWEVFGGGYSGEKRGMKKLSEIVSDIYLYYGFSEDDKKNRTERFSSLVTMLTS